MELAADVGAGGCGDEVEVLVGEVIAEEMVVVCAV